jgi:hypothetical protein
MHASFIRIDTSRPFFFAAMNRFLLILSFYLPLNLSSVCAQLVDSFSDGDFENNPAWSGDTAQFSVGSGVLELDASGSDSTFLVTPLGAILSNDTLEWFFELSLDFAPSSQNLARVYLWSDSDELEQQLNGLYLQFGETGAADAVMVRNQTGWASTTLFRGRDSLIAQGGTFQVKFTLTPGGTASLWTAESGSSLVFEGDFSTSLPPPSAYFGFKCIFTSSNAKAFGLDNVYAGNLRHDTVPPQLLTCSAENANSIRLKFDEPVFLTQGGLPLVFLSPPGLSCFAMQVDSLDASVVWIAPAVSLSDTVLYTLAVGGFRDEEGNGMVDTVSMELYLISDAVEGMVVISEIMSDPDDAPGLPTVEYLEIHNRSKAFVVMNGWTIADAATVSSIAADTLRPGAFRVITSSGGAALLNQSGIQVISVAGSMPSLNNDGDIIVLTGPLGVLDRVEYDPGMYRDPLRDDRGWSLERIDLDFTCHDRLNWKACTDSSGGTPGRNNSAWGTYSDNQAPVVVHVFPENDSTLRVYFSETMNQDVLAVPTNFVLDPSGVQPASALGSDGGNEVVLVFSSGVFQSGLSYVLRINATLSDCPGNALHGDLDFAFALPEQASYGDVIINEVLFNPHEDDGDFVEVYNASGKALDLYELKLLGLDEGGWPVGSPVSFGYGHRLLMPGQFAAASVNPDGLIARYGHADPAVMQQVDLPSLPDDAGGIAILNRSLQELERFQYNASMHHPLINEHEGISLERISARGPASDSDNWHSASSASGYATPGMRNSQSMDVVGQGDGSWFALSARLFSPDNDGQGDLLHIHASWPEPGFMGRVVVFTEGGQVVREFGVHELSGIESDWFWDGNNQDGLSCDEGIYFLIARFLHLNGQVLSIKTSCVLARKD